MLESLISFSIATILLAFSPGPDNLYVITQSLVNGTKSGIVDQSVAVVSIVDRCSRCSTHVPGRCSAMRVCVCLKNKFLSFYFVPSKVPFYKGYWIEK